MTQNQVIIFDTTLRDGEQSPGASMTRDEKVRIAKALERLGVDVIEAGFAVASPGDCDAVKAVASAITEDEYHERAVNEQRRRNQRCRPGILVVNSAFLIVRIILVHFVVSIYRVLHDLRYWISEFGKKLGLSPSVPS